MAALNGDTLQIIEKKNTLGYENPYFYSFFYSAVTLTSGLNSIKLLIHWNVTHLIDIDGLNLL